MKKNINGRTYDTCTAKLVHSYSNDLGRGDLFFFAEELYRKKTGEYFIYGEGGPGTIYSQMDADGWRSGGEKIIPISIAAAKEWIMMHAGEECYIAVFGI